MEKSQIYYFVFQNRKKFTNQDLLSVHQRLEQLGDKAALYLSAIKFKNPTTTLVLAWLPSTLLGVDGFYSGKIGFGVAKLMCLIVYGLVGICTGVFKLERDDELLAILLYVLGFGSIITFFVLFIIGVVNGAKWTRQYNFKKFMEATQAL